MDDPGSEGTDARLGAFRIVPATSVELPPSCPDEIPPDEALIRSVSRDGVIAPIPVVERGDGSLLVLGGIRRARAAQAVGRDLPVRIVEGSSLDGLRIAFNEDHVRGRARSTVERAWQVGQILAAARAEGLPATTRWLAGELSVSTGTAHNWRTIAEGLPPDRLDRLASHAGVPQSVLRRAPVRTALRLATTRNDQEAVKLVRALRPPQPPQPPRQPTPEHRLWGRLTGLFARLVAWLVRVTRVARRSAPAPEKEAGTADR